MNAAPSQVIQEACQRACTAKNQYVRLLRDKKKLPNALAVLREEALKYIPKDQVTADNIKAVEAYLVKRR